MNSTKVIIKRGYLEKKSRHIGSWRKRWTVLSQERKQNENYYYLSTYKNATDDEPPTERISIDHNTEIREISVTLKSNSFISNMFYIQNSTQKFIFKALSRSSSTAWIGMISRGISPDNVICDAIVIKEGYLYKQNDFSNKLAWKKQWTVLYKSQKNGYYIITYEKEKIYRLPTSKIEIDPNTQIKIINKNDRNKCFYIENTKSKEKIVFNTTSKAERDEWIKTLFYDICSHHKMNVPLTLPSLDECLILGLVRDTEISLIMPMDIVNLVLLFCTIGDNFNIYCSNKNIILDNIYSVDNKYKSRHQQISVKRYDLLHVFGTKQVYRDKYKWNLSVTTNNTYYQSNTIYIGVIDKDHIQSIYNHEINTDYFFSSTYHGYAVCMNTGDKYHNYSKDGIPYITSSIVSLASDNMITIELDLTGKIYGSIKVMVHKKNKTEYWNDICFAYDDILVSKTYQLAVVLGSGDNVILFDDYFTHQN